MAKRTILEQLLRVESVKTRETMPQMRERSKAEGWNEKFEEDYWRLTRLCRLNPNKKGERRNWMRRHYPTNYVELLAKSKVMQEQEEKDTLAEAVAAADAPANLVASVVAASEKILKVRAVKEADPAEKRSAVLQRRRLRGLRKLLKSVPSGRTASLPEVYDWVADHLETPPGSIKVSDVPKRSAISLLIEATSTPGGIERFFTRQRGLASNNQPADIERRFEESTEKLCELVDKIKRQWERAQGVVVEE